MEGADEPAGQSVQAALPSVPSVDVPAAQGSQAWGFEAPIAAEALPWLHSVQGEATVL